MKKITKKMSAILIEVGLAIAAVVFILYDMPLEGTMTFMLCLVWGNAK